jgi:hypothetical protein
MHDRAVVAGASIVPDEEFLIWRVEASLLVPPPKQPTLS